MRKLKAVKAAPENDRSQPCKVCEEASGIGWIYYQQPWNWSGGPQAKGVVGVVNASTPYGTRPSVNPKGYQAIGGIVGVNRARGHLLARQNKGSRRTALNLVPLEQNPFNRSVMVGVEDKMRGDRNRATVCFWIFPTYIGLKGLQGIPSKITMIWATSDGKFIYEQLAHPPGI